MLRRARRHGLAGGTLEGRAGAHFLQVVRQVSCPSVLGGELKVAGACTRLNTKLESNGYPPMTSLVKDLSDGVRLIQLMASTFSGALEQRADTVCRRRKSWVRPTFYTTRTVVQCQWLVGDTSLGRYNKNPRMRVQKAENVNKALEFITSRGVKLTNIGPEGSVHSRMRFT